MSVREAFAIPNYVIPTAACAFCGRAIFWVVPYGGQRVPLDAEGTYRGHVHTLRCTRKRIIVLRRRGVVREDATPRVTATLVSKHTDTPKEDAPRRWKKLGAHVRGQFARFGEVDPTTPVACGREIVPSSELDKPV